ncbi:MAG: TIGR03619 family F420-dependent LLM class oxidoreductase [Acidimicrobiia bacterium]|nr:TIGR03619 family F420-dependent LLM class oxidoreductase [Acidimicrobiia bacterium]
MEFGLHLPNAGPFANGPDIMRTARTAEELGFHSVWLFDHLFTPVNLESKYPYSPDGSYAMVPEFPFYDPVSCMAAVAGATERIKFGTRVLIPTYRHPVVLAKELATTDAIAGGRMILGVGAGWMAEEFDAVDVPMQSRFARLDEHVALMRQAWQKGTVAHEGRFYSHCEAGFGPQPPQPGNTIPIIVGGHGDAALRRAARWGDGWAVSAAGDQLSADADKAVGERLATLARFCDEEGRAIDDLLLVGQGFLGMPADAFRVQAGLGIDVIDLIAFAPIDQVIDDATKFMTEVAPALT